jgi:hypothetical protein
MDQLKDYADDRLINGCVYCTGPEETRDHVPSRVLLDAPFPENLPVVCSCYSCNQGFSRDEEYLACLLESVLAGSVEPDTIERPKVADILRRAPKLRARIEAARIADARGTRFQVEPDRIKNVVLKLARGHAAYELSQPCREEPASVWWRPLALMTEEQRAHYEASQVGRLLGEIGSRQSQRLLVREITLASPNGNTKVLGLLVNDWIDVQDNCYRYLAEDGDGMIRIKIVIREYLACEVIWAH